MQQQSTTPLDDIITPDELVRHYPDIFTKPQITWMLRNRDKNGLEKSGAAFMRGRKFYIHKTKFASWLIPQHQA